LKPTNFGHTAGHAIEVVTKYRRHRHGEAATYGMLVAAALARARGALAERDKQAPSDIVAGVGPLPPIADLSTAQILEAMKHDEKMDDDDHRRCGREGVEGPAEGGGIRPLAAGRYGHPSTVNGTHVLPRRDTQEERPM
jgi:hypothetical protein